MPTECLLSTSHFLRLCSGRKDEQERSWLQFLLESLSLVLFYMIFFSRNMVDLPISLFFAISTGLYLVCGNMYLNKFSYHLPLAITNLLQPPMYSLCLWACFSFFLFNLYDLIFKILKGCCWPTKRRWDSWPPEEKNSIWGQRRGWIAQSFCVIKFY